MKAKEYMMQIKKLDKLIDCKLREVEMLRCRAESITMALQPDKVQSSGNGDLVSTNVSAIVDLENEINAYIDELADKKREIMKVIDTLDPDYTEIMYKRYFQNMKWEQIAFEMNYSYVWICKLHGRALQEIQKNLN